MWRRSITRASQRAVPLPRSGRKDPCYCSFRYESNSPSLHPPSPPPTKWTFGRVLKYLTVGSGVVGLCYLGYQYRHHPPQDLPSIIIERLPNKNSPNEQLVVRRMSDTLEMYRRSIGEVLNEDPRVEKMRMNKKQIDHSLLQLQLTKDQRKRLEVAEALYHQKNLEVSSELAEKLHSMKLIEQSRSNSSDPLNKLMPNDPEIRACMVKKNEAEFAYLQTVIDTLSIRQYEQWIKCLKNAETGSIISPRLGKFRDEPVLVPIPSQRVVYVLNFKGDIMASQISKLRREITAVIENADPKRGDEVVILINSRGGDVSSYGLAAAQLERVKAAGLQLTVCIDEVAASGGYLMACVADRVIASPFATLGSIGVIAVAPNIYERLNREGIQVDDVTAGKYKRTLTPYRKWNSTDKEAMQKDVDAIHDIFKGFVKRYRPTVKINEVATGQVWLGYDAIKKGLCDELKTSDDLLLEMMRSDAVVLKLSSQAPPKGLLGRLRPKDEDLDLLDGNNAQLISFLLQIFQHYLDRSKASPPPSSPRPTLSYEDRIMMDDDETW